MEHIIRRLQAIHHALRTAPASFGGDSRVTEAVAGCLRQLEPSPPPPPPPTPIQRWKRAFV